MCKGAKDLTMNSLEKLCSQFWKSMVELFTTKSKQYRKFSFLVCLMSLSKWLFNFPWVLFEQTSPFELYTYMKFIWKNDLKIPLSTVKLKHCPLSIVVSKNGGIIICSNIVYACACACECLNHTKCPLFFFQRCCWSSFYRI